LNNSILANIRKKSQTNENDYFVIHNHEVPSSILGLATWNREVYERSWTSLFLFAHNSPIYYNLFSRCAL